jgi:hypothetical protein
MAEKLLELQFSAVLQPVADGVRASYVVRFPTASGLRPQAASADLVDRAAAEAWIQDQAARRGVKAITWQADTPTDPPA